jgi:hypothetical protein
MFGGETVSQEFRSPLTLLRYWLFAGCLAAIIYHGYRADRWSGSLPRAADNLNRTIDGILPVMSDPDRIGDLMRSCSIQGPTRVALPPQYVGNWPNNDDKIGNVAYQAGITNFPDLTFVSSPFPLPKLVVTQAAPPYRFDNHKVNAALITFIDQQLWPYGYTAWIDLVTTPHTIEMVTPWLRTVDGRRLSPRRVQTVSALNQAALKEGGATRVTMQHWSPLVWEFSEAGQLPAELSAYVLEADGRQISAIPPLPTEPHDLLGVMLLQRQIPAPAADAPAWWVLDEALRRAVVEGAGAVVAEPLFQRLATSYPQHPLLDHYRVVASLHGARFSGEWKKQQARGCALDTWQLLPFTDLGWSDVNKLPCLAQLETKTGFVREHILAPVIRHFSTRRDEPALTSMGEALVEHSYLSRDPTAFSYPTTDFAFLWLHAKNE